MSARGHNGGFDPFRSHGKFASGGRADATSDPGAAKWANRAGIKNDTIKSTGKESGGVETVNAAIRGAAGRPTRTSPEATLAKAADAVAAAAAVAPTEAEYAAMPVPDVEKVSAKSRAAINKAFSMVDPGAFEDDPKYDAVHVGSTQYGDDLNGVAAHVLTGLMQRGPSNPSDRHSVARNKDIAKALIGAYADTGIQPAKNLTPKKMLEIFDSVSANWGKPGSAQADGHAIASALSMGDMELAFTITDGQGAGIGWPLARRDFRTQHNLPADGRDEEGQS